MPRSLRRRQGLRRLPRLRSKPMRYVVLVAMSVLGTILSGTLFGTIELWGLGLQIDIVFLIVMSLVLVEKSVMPIVFAAVTGLLMDMTYSTQLGMYALSYTAAAAVGLFVFRKMEKFNLLHLFTIGAVGYIFKELMMAFIVFSQGARDINLGMIMVKGILPSAALNGALLLVAYLLVSRLYRNAWMRPRAAAHYLDEF